MGASAPGSLRGGPRAVCTMPLSSGPLRPHRPPWTAAAFARARSNAAAWSSRRRSHARLAAPVAHRLIPSRPHVYGVLPHSLGNHNASFPELRLFSSSSSSSSSAVRAPCLLLLVDARSPHFANPPLELHGGLHPQTHFRLLGQTPTRLPLPPDH